MNLCHYDCHLEKITAEQNGFSLGIWLGYLWVAGGGRHTDVWVGGVGVDGVMLCSEEFLWI